MYTAVLNLQVSGVFARFQPRISSAGCFAKCVDYWCRLHPNPSTAHCSTAKQIRVYVVGCAHTQCLQVPGVEILGFISEAKRPLLRMILPCGFSAALGFFVVAACLALPADVSSVPCAASFSREAQARRQTCQQKTVKVAKSLPSLPAISTLDIQCWREAACV